MTEYIGTTVCDECGARFRVAKKHQDRLGKPVRCSKCKSIFTAELVAPTPLEIASTENAQETGETEYEARRRRRRSKSEIKQETIDSIRNGFRKLHPQLVEIAARNSSEEDIRIWCCNALVHALGYDQSKNIKTEVKVLGQSADIVLHQNDQVFLVIECKNTKSHLRSQVRDQAAGYAMNFSAEWIVITNGLIWKLYRVIPQPGKDPKFIEVFDVALLDEDGVSEEDAENLYLISPRAVFCGDLEKKSHEVACTSKKRILRALESERVVKALKTQLATSYKDEYNVNVKLDEQMVSDSIQDTLGQNEL